MSLPGNAELLIGARAALLDALDALDALAQQRDALVLIGAQAIYLHTGAAPVALAETTKDSDLAIDPRALGDSPLLEEAMQRAGFHRDLEHPQPGSWLSSDGIPVDLMVPEALSGASGRRGARIPPHSRHATRRTPGLEAAVVDHAWQTIGALDPADRRSAEINVAGPAALLVAVDTQMLVATLRELAADELAGESTLRAISHLEALFAPGPQALGSAMAGRAEQLVGDPAVVSAAVAALAEDLLRAIG